MLYLFLTLLVGIHISPIAFPHLTIWDAHQFWAQTFILVLFSFSFFVNCKKMPRKNIPLGLLHLWVCLLTMVVCYVSMKNGKLNVRNYYPYLNFLYALILIKIFCEQLESRTIKIILVWMKYTIIATLLFCTLQVFGLSQFLKMYNLGDKWEYSRVIGFIGNGTHLSGFLACSIPLFLYKRKRIDILALILMFLVLLYCGTVVSDPSISGFVVGGFIFLYMVRIKWYWYLSFLLFVPLLKFMPENFLGLTGRMTYWKPFWNLFYQFPITGSGLGRVAMIFEQHHLINAKHLHMEYFHYMFELGIVGLILIMNLIIDFVKTKPISEVQRVLKAMVLGFLVSCAFNFPAHLWLPSLWALFAYASFITLKQENYYGF